MPAFHLGRRHFLLILIFGATSLGPMGCGGKSDGGTTIGAVDAAKQHSTMKQDANGSQPSVASAGSAQTPPGAPPRDRQAEDADLAAIARLEGRVESDGPDRTVVKVDLGRPKVTDADLVHLKLFTNLQELGLHAPYVTDAGLQHLQGLTNLRVLDLNFTSISGPGLVHLRGMSRLQELDLGSSHLQDAGLEYLKGLTQLQTLNLKLTAVSDAGLEHLKALLNLEQLDVRLTRVTEAGVQKLKQALPKVRIEY